MRTIEDLHAGYRTFRQGRYADEADRFAQLAGGQSPAIMVIACADSRVDPATIFAAAPGELFIIRNVANLVPPYELEGKYHGTSAGLEFAVTALRVRHIVIMGHADCGGLRAAMAAASGEGPAGTFIAPWVSMASAACREVIETMPDADETARRDALERLAIRHSIENLQTFPFVQSAIEAGDLSLHGAYFSIAAGRLHWLDNDTGDFATVDD